MQGWLGPGVMDPPPPPPPNKNARPTNKKREHNNNNSDNNSDNNNSSSSSSSKNNDDAGNRSNAPTNTPRAAMNPTRVTTSSGLPFRSWYSRGTAPAAMPAMTYRFACGHGEWGREGAGDKQ